MARMGNCTCDIFFSLYPIYYKNKSTLQHSCEIEDFVETRLCKLAVILLRSRVLLGVCPH